MCSDVVYPVDGSMEDWMYASGWDKSDVKKCNVDQGKLIDDNGDEYFIAIYYICRL